ncbi:hypothetical protein NXX38_17005 [Bacteroides sp. BFG-637]|nr:hypothetical protein [Bacteroides sp. BFG-637]MCS3313499.1 hypothetical protein [Bacteroides sp. BFG-637]
MMILGSTVDGSWTQSVFNYTPLLWMYWFDLLEILIYRYSRQYSWRIFSGVDENISKRDGDYATSPYLK